MLVSLLGISALIRNLREVLHKSITEYDNHVGYFDPSLEPFKHTGFPGSRTRGSDW